MMSRGPEPASAAAFSDYHCSASGATATSHFRPHGAVPNGTTDDTSAIQNAIDTASSAGGGVVTLPAGTFLINGHLVVKSNVKLAGAYQPSDGERIAVVLCGANTDPATLA
jgi:polygalacturonase